VSVAIQSSLHKLNSAVQKLETAVNSFDAKKAKASVRGAVIAQDDLFAAPSAPRNPDNNPNNLNVRQLAARLDTAIHQVEKILTGGRG
jgi:hypothetical protein